MLLGLNAKVGIQVFDAVSVRDGCESAIICSSKTHFMVVALLMSN
jgi:hypothetical protein